MTSPPTLDGLMDSLADRDPTPVALYGELAPVYRFVVEWSAIPAVQYDAVTTRFGDAPSSVVEFACGVGALLDRLHDHYDAAVGLDRSRPLLRIARSKTDAPLVLGDVRRVGLSRRFDAAVMLGNSVGHLMAPADLERCFGAVADSLAPGGQFFFDCPDLDTQRDAEHKEHPLDGEAYRVHHEGEIGPADPETGLVERRDSFSITEKSSGRTVSAETGSWEFRAYDAETIRAALESAGFDVLSVETTDKHEFLAERR